MSGGSAPAAPDYTPLANASREASERSYALQKEQLDWAKKTYAEQEPLAREYLTNMMAASNEQLGYARTDRERYKTEFQPIEDKFLKDAKGWDSPERATQRAAAAEADVGNAMDQQRHATMAQLQSYGIDPSTLRFSSGLQKHDLAKAAAMAAAGTSSRLNTEQQGIQMRGQAIELGRAYAGGTGAQYGSAAQTGAAGFGTNNQTQSTFGNLMGTPYQWNSSGNAALMGAAGIKNMGFQNQATAVGIDNQNSANQSAGIGSAVGAGIGIASLAVMA